MKRSPVLITLLLVISSALIYGFGYLLLRDPDLPSLTLAQFETMLKQDEIAEMTVVENKNFVEVTLNERGRSNPAYYQDSDNSFNADPKYQLPFSDLESIRSVIDKGQANLPDDQRTGYHLEIRGDSTLLPFEFAVFALLMVGYYFVKFILPAGLLYLIFREVRSFVRKRREIESTESTSTSLPPKDTSGLSPHHFPIKTGGKTIMKGFDEITCFFAQDNCVYLYDQEGQEMLVDATLSKLEVALPPQFMRVHRSYIINADYIQEMKKQPGSRFRIQLRGRNAKAITSGQSYALRMKELLVV